ncbi:MAG: mandelate racemase [Paracoccaceae bacterium]|jgi:mandelate racemase
MTPDNPKPFGTTRDEADLGGSDLTIESIQVRAVLAPMPKPLKTASGQLAHVAVLLIDLQTSQGITGVSYLFSPRQDMLKVFGETIHALSASIQGMRCDPVAIAAFLDRQFLLFGGTGVVTMARAGIDMALWDAIAKEREKPLFDLLGGENVPIKAYESSGLGLSGWKEVAEEAEGFARSGFAEMKIRLGYPTLAQDIQVLTAVRSAVGPDIGLMVDYNQSLPFEIALERCLALDPFQLLWIEEPVHAADLEGAAALTGRIETPIQIGENLFSPTEVNRALALRSSTYLMPDVMKIGGVTTWLTAAHSARQHTIPVSSHLFPEISTHLLACAPNRHFLEYANWTDAILQEPVLPQNGYVQPREKPGAGIAWDTSAVAKFQI